MTHAEIARLNEEYGGGWAIQHSERLLRLVEMLADGEPYHTEAIWLAAYLHDWGGYAKWMQPGVEHYERSREVAEAFLEKHGYPAELSALVLECIACHHGGPAGRSRESILFTDADALDLLGVCGILRIFSMVPRDLRAARQAVERWKQTSLAAIRTEKGRRLAEQRVREGEALLQRFEEETFGLY